MKLYLIRHGETNWNAAGKIQGSIDIELNATGIQQAEELVKKIQEEQIDLSCVYTSTLKRAKQTGAIVSAGLNIPTKLLPGTEEINLGDFEGHTWDEVRELFPNEYEVWYQDRRYAIPPNGESYDAMVKRVIDAIKKAIANETKDFAIITHGAVIMCLQCYLNDVPFRKMRMYKAENTSILCLDEAVFQTEK